jgi:hypothetical protein
VKSYVVKEKNETTKIQSLSKLIKRVCFLRASNEVEDASAGDLKPLKNL